MVTTSLMGMLEHGWFRTELSRNRDGAHVSLMFTQRVGAEKTFLDLNSLLAILINGFLICIAGTHTGRAIAACVAARPQRERRLQSSIFTICFP